MTKLHYEYVRGTVRWARWTGDEDVRCHRKEGWEIQAVMLDEHPTTGKPFPQAEWWVRERKE